ncbi:hypothetical protein IWQ60_004836 [Tieghemiomyces parasiticus]|uniref:Uncharacterized protein n=1 Tax=Tieghemiomyces parasiticus TaxID=78921 RepID=A0A9W8A7L3_9FUNG|nr:hypothetical protein IWQ60_004836 [Tieghemiomyces parasiticus]
MATRSPFSLNGCSLGSFGDGCPGSTERARRPSAADSLPSQFARADQGSRSSWDTLAHAAATHPQTFTPSPADPAQLDRTQAYFRARSHLPWSTTPATRHSAPTVPPREPAARRPPVDRAESRAKSLSGCHPPRSLTRRPSSGGAGLLRLMPATLILPRPLCQEPATGARYYRVDTAVLNLSRHPVQLRVVPRYHAAVVSGESLTVAPGGLADLTCVLAFGASFFTVRGPHSVSVDLVVAGHPRATLHLRLL